VINAGEKSVKDKERQDKKGIGQEFFCIQQPGDNEIGIQIVKGDNNPVVHDEEGGQISFGKNIILSVSGNGIKDQGQQEEAGPCGDVYDDLYGNFFQY
jgi:hypothetical protein